MKDRDKVQYGVWGVDCNDETYQYWLMYNSLEDAVSENGDGTEVYELTPKLLGIFQRKVSIVKHKTRKTKKEKV